MAVAALDDSQREAASIVPEGRQIVLAGPGAGKSEVVGALAANLVEEHDVFPEEVLVISFSRAAVGVVEQRTAEVVDQGEVVEVRTIDSLAAQIIDTLTDEQRSFRGHDQAIEDATRLVRASEEAPLGHLRHIIVDEVQDVVGVRAEFVLALLEEAVQEDTGFTLLGDPLQSLYDFQLDDKHPLTSSSFLDAVSAQLDARVVELTTEYRSRTPNARKIAQLRPELMQLTAGKRLRRLEATRAALSPLGDLDADAIATVSGWSGSTALLCDTNARAALAASHLAEGGLLAEIAAGATDDALPAWLARTLATHPRDRIDRDAFDAACPGSGCPDPDESWGRMLDLAGVGRELDIRELAVELGTSRGRNLFRRAPESAVIVSTVHRAKGLEFDDVVLVDPDEWVTGGSDDAERTSPLLYVAMSRARDRVTTVDGVEAGRWRRGRSTQGRRPWVMKSWRGNGLLGVIMEPWMGRSLGPVDPQVGRFAGRGLTWEHGDPLQTDDGMEVPSWIASVDDVAVARTGEELGLLVSSSTWGDAAPNLIGGRVHGFETAVGRPRSSPPGQHGLWLSARIAGPIRLDWE